MRSDPLRAVAAFLLLAAAPAPAWALCSGKELAEEYAEADAVIRARLVSEINAWSDEPTPDHKARWGETSVVLYGLKTLETFKGDPGPLVSFFEERNSGAFYVDIDKDYLLFLHRIPSRPGQPESARGAFHVRYACGQSKKWVEVRPEDLAELRLLSARHGK